ncbi:ABC transporter substrate-binding protein [Janthinobacterium agaricidamnosum]|uniref:Bacterial extracellular solute-binding s, 5 Middle family protein n=1 Tax=Janthinobacterium agaricidamnosum NBRC 102515 = DSM 9628 TaxID=1349767 RepID=W0VC80_9BURK|nr:ABC transporter substrate-binding protein [Janthinobacterium agaricidamnosum]CDG84912.1 bacterial extracellular solute-binding s, 5 Middle family protein [Janthinobacterium agaricidamnosum NBRC 102515 = DSM 9628]
MKSPWIRRLALAACIGMAGITPLAASAAAAAKAPVKVLRYILPAAETGFDPATARDLYSNLIVQAMFDTLYTYDYLARPARIVPQAAAALPEISADGKTYTIRLKKGILFTPDPAFKGKRRELTMADFVYSWKRLFDPRLASPHSWLFENKIVGFDELAAEAKKTNKLDYDKNVAGFEILDPYTLRIHLKQTDFNLPMVLAHQPTSALAREVVEKYGDIKGEVASNPVGSAFYKLGEWVRGNRIVLNENTDHLPETWNFQAGDDPDDQRIVAQMKGKKIPQIGRIEISVMIEDQSRWLSFQSGGTDLFWLDGPLAPKAMLDGKLRPELATKGVQLSRLLDPEMTYYYWNMEDPVLGGFSKEKIALRRAIAMAHNIDEEIRIVWNGQAQRLDYPIPPGVVGYDPKYKSLLQYDPVLANKLLDKFGYKKGADGWRTLPDGKPLLIRYVSRNEANGVLQAEMWRKTYNAIGIRMENDRMIFSDIMKEEKNCKLQTRTAPWIADYPDGDNFMQLFYGPNAKQNNNGCYQDPVYDQWYAASQKLPDGPERDALYHKMARQLEVNAGSLIGYARYRNMLAQKTVLGYKKHPVLLEEFQYIDIDPALAK